MGGADVQRQHAFGILNCICKQNIDNFKQFLESSWGYHKTSKTRTDKMKPHQLTVLSTINVISIVQALSIDGISIAQALSNDDGSIAWALFIDDGSITQALSIDNGSIA